MDPTSTKKWGIKSWVLAGSTNGYTWNIKLYTGMWMIIHQNILSMVSYREG